MDFSLHCICMSGMKIWMGHHYKNAEKVEKIRKTQKILEKVLTYKNRCGNIIKLSLMSGRGALKNKFEKS